MLNPNAHDFKPIEFLTPPEKAIVNKPKKKPAAKKSAPKKVEQTLKTESPKKAGGPKKVEAKTTEAKKKKNTKKPTEASHGKRRDSQANSSQITESTAEWTESAFIAIEAAIDPIHRIDKSSKKIFEHGYERYIDWVNNIFHASNNSTNEANRLIDL